MLERLSDDEMILTGYIRHLWNVVGEEAGDDESALGCEVLDIGGHVGSEDILVNIGDNGAECSLNGGGIAELHIYIIYIIKGKIFLGIRRCQ